VDQRYEVYAAGETDRVAVGRTNWGQDLPPGTYDVRLLPWRDSEGLFRAEEEWRKGVIIKAGEVTEITLSTLRVVEE
jgi:hypothetical protein